MVYKLIFLFGKYSSYIYVILKMNIKRIKNSDDDVIGIIVVLLWIIDKKTHIIKHKEILIFFVISRSAEICIDQLEKNLGSVFFKKSELCYFYFAIRFISLNPFSFLFLINPQVV